MEITVTGRKKSVSDRFRRHLEEKLDKIPQLAPRVSRVEVVLTHETNPRLAKQAERAEITCFISRTVVRAEAAAEEEYAALDLAMAKLTERLRRESDRHRISHTGKHRMPSVAEATNGLSTEPLGEGGPEQAGSPDVTEVVDRELGTEGNSPIELREKVHTSEPMTVGQALTQMELLGHDFFLFSDADTGTPSVVYRRRGWSYGVLRLQNATPEDQAEAQAEAQAGNGAAASAEPARAAG